MWGWRFELGKGSMKSEEYIYVDVGEVDCFLVKFGLDIC